MLNKSHGGLRKGSGRKKINEHISRARLTSEQIRTAKTLGNGNLSAGIREALDFIKNTKND